MSATKRKPRRVVEQCSHEDVSVCRRTILPKLPTRVADLPRAVSTASVDIETELTCRICGAVRFDVGNHQGPWMPREDPEHLAKIRRLPCCVCGKEPAGEAHHSTLSEHGHGMGRKSADWAAIPLCGPFGCHGQFHDHLGRFWGWSREQRQNFQREMVRRYRPRAKGNVF